MSAALKAALAKAMAAPAEGRGPRRRESVSAAIFPICSTITDKEAQKAGDQFIASEMFLLALTQDKGEAAACSRKPAAMRRRWRRGKGRARR
jgi:ATP-dependent Clp protease ATP-binding subunit ClpB